MKVVDKLNNKRTISVEIEPPVLGESISALQEFLDPLAGIGVDFIDITYHPEQIIKTVRSNGQMISISQRKKPGTAGIAAAIKNKYSGVEPVPHVICTGFNAYETEEFLVELNYLGIENLLALRGDCPKAIDGTKLAFPRVPYGYKHANELIKQIADLRKGVYVGAESGVAIDFCTGAACYPEKHAKAKIWEEELDWTKAKVDAGADYLVTQMFFDNSKYFNFVHQARQKGISTPILPGVKILTTINQAKTLPEYFGCSLPCELKKEITTHSDNVRQIGIEWCVNQCRELLKYGVPGLHFYAARKSPVRQVLEKII